MDTDNVKPDWQNNKAEKDKLRNRISFDLPEAQTEQIRLLKDYYQVSQSDIGEVLIGYALSSLYEGTFTLDGRRSPIENPSPVLPKYEMNALPPYSLDALKTRLNEDTKDQKRDVDGWGRPMCYQ